MAVPSTKSLISLADAKRYMNISTAETDNDRLLDALVTQACVMIQKELGCDIIEMDYTKEVHSGRGRKMLTLKNYPLQWVNRISVDTDYALRLRYTGIGSRATAAVTSNSIRLRSVTSGVWITNTLVISDSVTMDLMATAVSAETDWEGTVFSTYGDFASADLIVRPAWDAKNVYVDLEIPQECEDDYEIYDAEQALLYNPYVWTAGRRNIFVDYRAGYGRAEIPEPIQAATLELVKFLFDLAQKDASLKSEQIGDYRYSVADRMDAVFSTSGKESVSNMISMKLAPYQREYIVGF